jgi:hypothetical protein
MYITEKIDGTNGIIFVDPDGSVYAGSRNRWLTNEDGTPPNPEQDNYGFGAWVHETREALKKLGPGFHYGEWYGAGIQRGYGMTTKRWASFEFYRRDEHPEWDKVPAMHIGAYDPAAILGAIDRLKASGSILVPGFMKPEGIVISFKNAKGAKFKKLCENDAIHKSELHAEAPCQTL